MTGVIIGVVVFLFFLIITASACIKIAQEYERGVIFRLSRFTSIGGPLDVGKNGVKYTLLT